MRDENPTSYTPALGVRWLTPFYDAAIQLLTRERRWRSRLIDAMSPSPRDRILDVGCGTGQLGLGILRRSPDVRFVGLDPDPDVLAIARRRFARAHLAPMLLHGFLSTTLLRTQAPFSKVVCSLVLHQVPRPEKLRLLSLMQDALVPHGQLFIADYAEQSTRCMRVLFRNTVQRLDGLENTEPNARGILPEVMQEIGMRSIQLVERIPTLTGEISIYQAHKRFVEAGEESVSTDARE